MDKPNIVIHDELDQLLYELHTAVQRLRDLNLVQVSSQQNCISLRTAHDEARAHQQLFYSAHIKAWEAWTKAQNETSRVHIASKAAHNERQEMYKALVQMRNKNEPQITEINNRYGELKKRIVQLSIDIEKLALEHRDSKVKSAIKMAKELRVTLDEMAAERNNLLNEIRTVRAAHAQLVAHYDHLRAEFDRLRSVSDQLKRDHKEVTDKFKAAKATRLQINEAYDNAVAAHEQLVHQFQQAKLPWLVCTTSSLITADQI